MCAHVHIIVYFQLIYYQVAEATKCKYFARLEEKTRNLKSKLEYISLTKLYISYFFINHIHDKISKPLLQIENKIPNGF